MFCIISKILVYSHVFTLFPTFSFFFKIWLHFNMYNSSSSIRFFLSLQSCPSYNFTLTCNWGSKTQNGRTAPFILIVVLYFEQKLLLYKFILEFVKKSHGSFRISNGPWSKLMWLPEGGLWETAFRVEKRLSVNDSR